MATTTTTSKPRKVTDIASKRTKETAEDIAISESDKLALLEVAGAWQARSGDLDAATWALAYKVREVFLASAGSAQAFPAIARIIQPVAPDLVMRGSDTAVYNRQYAQRLSTFNNTAARWPEGATMPNTSFTAHSNMVGGLNRADEKGGKKIAATLIETATKQGGLSKSEALDAFDKAAKRHKVTLKAKTGRTSKVVNGTGRDDTPDTESDPMWLATEIHRLSNALTGVIAETGGRYVADEVAVAHLLPAIETLGKLVSADQRKASKAS